MTDETPTPAASATPVAPAATPAVPPSEPSPVLIGGQTPAVESTEPAVGAGTEATPAGVPYKDVGADFLSPLIPEGYEITPEQSGELLTILNEAKGDMGKTVQGLLALYAQESTKMQEHIQQQVLAQQTAWQDEIRNDPQFGGQKLEASLAAANELVRKFGGQGMKEVLEATGAGNSIHFLRFLHNIKAALPSEGQPISGTATAKPKSLADRLMSGN